MVYSAGLWCPLLYKLFLLCQTMFANHRCLNWAHCTEILRSLSHGQPLSLDFPSPTSKMWSASERRSMSRAAQRVPSHWFQTRTYPHWSSLVLFIMSFCNWCSVWNIPWPTLAWNKLPCPIGLFFFSGSLSCFSAYLMLLLIRWAERVLLGPF